MNKFQQAAIQFICILTYFLSHNTINAQTYAKNGMVVSSNSISSEVGISILKKGGNAIDAAVATAFSLAVTLPSAGNIGGGGFLVYMNSKGEATTIDFREKAPFAATTDMYLDENGNVVSSRRRTELTAVGVPGTVARLYLAHQKYGKLPWKTKSVSYELEYGTDALEIHEDAITEGQNVLIVDDLLATGGATEATCKLVSKLGGNIKGLSVLIELEDLNGRKRLNQYNVHSLVQY